MAKLLLFTDGGARGNPGPAAIGVVVKIQNGETKEIHSFGKKIGNATNNFAEYLAIIEALHWIYDNQNKFLDITNIEVYLDSNLVVNQLNGKFKVKNQELMNLFYTTRELEKQLTKKNIKYFFIPRSDNLKADYLVNKALDS